MNWLQKVGQADFDLSQYDFPSDTYLDIGHDDEIQSFVWAYVNGDIEAEPVGPKTTHDHMWNGNLLQKTYSGRYEPDSGKVSVVTPIDKRHQSIPGVVMDALKFKFPNLKRVITF